MNRRVALLAVTLVLVAVPFCVVRYPPAADLPQHLAQLRLLEAALSEGAHVYRVAWANPNNLIYALIGVFWVWLPPVAAGRATLVTLALAQAAALAWVAWKRGRSPEAAVLAAVLVFNHCLYWGFLNFQIGWPFFLVWLVRTSQPEPERRPWRDRAALAVVVWLLYGSHILWLAAGIAWLALAPFVVRLPAKTWAWRVGTLVPAALPAAVWGSTLFSGRASTFDVAARWLDPPWQRLHPAWLVDATLGGLHGATEAVVSAMLLAWMLGAVAGRGREAGDSIDRVLVTAGGFLAAVALLAPDKYVNTILFALRWWPCAVALLLLGLPAPRLAPRLRALAAASVLATFCIVTAASWIRFEREELSGLSASLDALPSGPRLLGLDMVQESDVLKGRPFLQTFAWGQALRGGELNFSFAEHGSTIVVYREPRKVPWSSSLEWYAERLRRSDLRHFDYVLLNAVPDLHASFAGYGVVAVTTSGRWRLYRAPAVRPAAGPVSPGSEAPTSEPRARAHRPPANPAARRR